MSRSNPQHSAIAEKLRKNSPTTPPHQRSLRRRVLIRIASLARWLHIYSSLFGLATVLFFSVTGLTLNHPDLFFKETARRSETSGVLTVEWVKQPKKSDQFHIAEHLRKVDGVHGAAEFTDDEDQACLVAFRGPGYTADATIQRSTGEYQLTQTAHGFTAIINDLHKGRDSGPVWKAVIDVSAVLLVFISITGFVLLFYLKLRRMKGLVVTLVGTVVLTGLWWLGVP